jgi:hypothetical protein
MQIPGQAQQEQRVFNVGFGTACGKNAMIEPPRRQERQEETRENQNTESQQCDFMIY